MISYDIIERVVAWWHQPMLTNQWGLVAFTWGQFHRKCSRKLALLLSNQISLIHGLGWVGLWGLDLLLSNQISLIHGLGWVGLWGFLWWAPSAKRKDHHGVSSGWSSTWFHSNTGLTGTQYEQIPIIFGVWTFWLTVFFFRSIIFWQV